MKISTLLLAPIAAEPPKQQPAYFVKVVFVVINRVRGALECGLDILVRL